jgi:hypothetical protein
MRQVHGIAIDPDAAIGIDLDEDPGAGQILDVRGDPSYGADREESAQGPQGDHWRPGL